MPEGRWWGGAGARCLFGLVVGERGAEESVGPLLGEWSCLGEVDRDGRVADGECGEQFGDESGLGVLELEQAGVAVLDHDGGARERGQVGDRVGELPVDQAPDEIIEALALDDGRRSGRRVGDAVVAGGQCASLGVGLLLGELVGVALAACRRGS